eukprot:CAMPEP_0198693762 /NCGR_PEP_ID=MMETSP1468-20131203/256748_1 /TAXON_ID=1461545 /ORGANISM="Mantoniella sp, Strain CCMP1436" /LENGTH=96 /DNA_ID=CAMNT_0044448599 /DNA_START=25 /DNA_END=315 /DNA_ORIENTATION=-
MASIADVNCSASRKARTWNGDEVDSPAVKSAAAPGVPQVKVGASISRRRCPRRDVEVEVDFGIEGSVDTDIAHGGSLVGDVDGNGRGCGDDADVEG